MGPQPSICWLQKPSSTLVKGFVVKANASARFAIFLLDLRHFLFNSGRSVRRILRLRFTVSEPHDPFAAVCADRELQIAFFSAISPQGIVRSSWQAVAQGFLSFFVEY